MFASIISCLSYGVGNRFWAAERLAIFMSCPWTNFKMLFSSPSNIGFPASDTGTHKASGFCLNSLASPVGCLPL